MRRLTGDEHLDSAFATTWPEYEMDARTRAMLSFATKLTESPGMVGAEDVDALARAGWEPDAIWQIAALTSFFNFSGRMEAASGLPPDEIPDDAQFAEARG